MKKVYREDDDLKFLGLVESKDLNDLVRCLIYDKEGKKRLTEELSKNALYVKYQPDHHQYWKEIATEIQCFGANTIATLFRSGKGELYKKILWDVCDKLKIKYKKESAIEKIEMDLVSGTLKKMKSEELKKIAESLGMENTEGITANVLTKLFQNAFFEGDYWAHQITLFVVDAVQKSKNEQKNDDFISLDILGPAFRVTIPVVFQIAALRRKYLAIEPVEENSLDVEKEYQELICMIKKAIENVDCSGTINQQSKEFKSKLPTTLKEKFFYVQKSIEQSKKDMRWDKLVISFFGETNAGKSTIIETFRILFDPNRPQASDGVIVGDGQSDFTKEYHEYDLSIDNHPFILIDVPGIEGNEADFKDGIKKALSKSHCVFYVHGHNKPLETPIIEKIRSYLGDWVQVYSIYNVRGGINNYDEPEERENLLNESIVKIENEIKSVFHNSLGNVYKGNITLQALLAMCAKASFSPERDDLSRKQKKLLEFFESANGILKYSQFQTLINQVQQKAENFVDEILSSNILKVKSLKKEISKELDSIITESGMGPYMSQLNQFESDLEYITGLTTRNLSNRVNSLITLKFDSTMQKVNEIIASKSKNKKEQLASCISNLAADIQKNIPQIVNECSKRWNEFVEMKSSNFDGFDNLSLQITRIQKKGDLNIDFSEVLKKLEISLQDVGGFAAAAGGGALVGAVGGPIGAAIGGVVGGASYIGKKYIFGDHGVGEAQQIAKQNLMDCKYKFKYEVDGRVEEMQEKFINRKKEISLIVQNELHSVEEILSIITEMKVRFKKVVFS